MAIAGGDSVAVAASQGKATHAAVEGILSSGSVSRDAESAISAAAPSASQESSAVSSDDAVAQGTSIEDGDGNMLVLGDEGKSTKSRT